MQPELDVKFLALQNAWYPSATCNARALIGFVVSRSGELLSPTCAARSLGSCAGEVRRSRLASSDAEVCVEIASAESDRVPAGPLQERPQRIRVRTFSSVLHQCGLVLTAASSMPRGRRAQAYGSRLVELSCQCLCDALCLSLVVHLASPGVLVFRRLRKSVGVGAAHSSWWRAALGDAPRRRRLRGMGSTRAALVC